MSNAQPIIAALVPCYNESLTIAKVCDDFKKYLPEATVYVYDNNSSDGTAKIAAEHGAVVVHEGRQGKGNVVRQMLRDIDADCYVMVDGDDTYPIEQVREVIAPILDGTADHVVGDRLSNGTYAAENKRAGHGFGNDLVRWLIKVLYGFEYTDVMTGYRAFNREFAKTLPVLSPGFEIETELSIHAVDKNWRIVQVPIDYRDRPEGSESKLNTVSDGIKVLKMIFSLFKDYKPLGVLLADRARVLCHRACTGHSRDRRVRGDGSGPEVPDGDPRRGVLRARCAHARVWPHPRHRGQGQPPRLGAPRHRGLRAEIAESSSLIDGLWVDKH